MKRREFIAGLGSGVAWPLAARSQQGEQVRPVGVLMAYGDEEPEAKACLAAFLQGTRELGWAEGRNLRIDI